MTDLSRVARPPFGHQVVGIERLVRMDDPTVGRVIPGCFLLGDEMRLGKSKQVIDAAQVLFDQKKIAVVIVVVPAPVRGVWFDPELGEIAKNRWKGLPTFVQEHHIRCREWSEDCDLSKPFLRWVITNYEFIRYAVKRESSGWRGPHLDPLLKISEKTMLVLDESSAVSNFQSLQSRACTAIRKRCERVVLLNGTPYGENPEDIFGQARLMDRRILGMEHLGQFRSTYAIMGGYQAEIVRYGKKIKVPVEVVGWRHRKRPGCCEIPPHISSPVHGLGPGLEDLRAKMAPYVLRRLKSDCLDLPPKLEPVTLTAVLTPATWKVYKEMRDDTVAWLDKHTAAVSLQAGVAVMRLAQITSGFVGGIKDMAAVCPECAGSGARQIGPPPAAAPLSGSNLDQEDCLACGGQGTLPLAVPPREVGREKLDLYLDWVGQRLKSDHDMQMLVWFRFRLELMRAVRELEEKFPGVTVRSIYGGQKKAEREENLRLMHPDVPREGPGLLAGTLGTGAKGLNMARAHEVVHMSQINSLEVRQQSDDRPHGPGQTQPISYHDVIAVGPNGEKTIDHIIVKEQRTKHDLSTWTTSAWVEALIKE